MNQTPGRYFENPAFREYIFLLVELERLFREGRGQTSEADAIREAMDFPSHRFSADEDRAIRSFAHYLTDMNQKYGPILPRTELPRSADIVVPEHPAPRSHQDNVPEFSK
jgi:hypothetical protein